VAFSVKESEAAAAAEVIPLTRKRTAGQRGIIWISDGHHAYMKYVRRTYRAPLRTGAPGRPRFVRTPGVGLTQVVKVRERGHIVKVYVRHCFGPEPEFPYTVRVERLNGVLRDRLNCLTRKTHGFAKRDNTWAALVGLSLFEHNWMCPHVALREKRADLPNGRFYRQRSPAMAVGLTDHIWNWVEFLSRRIDQCKCG
jgi:hypothetical protein